MLGHLYVNVTDRIIALLEEGDLDTPVPATPAWSVGDLLRHLVGLAVDASNLNLAGYGSDAWTAGHVTARAAMGLDALVEEWRSVIPQLAALLNDPSTLPETVETAQGPSPSSFIPPAILADATIHEHDLRGALGNSEERTSMELLGVLDGMVRQVRSGFKQHDLPTLLVESIDTGQSWPMGRDEPVATLRATAYDLFRAVGGRRSRSQVAALDWSGDHEQFHAHIVGPFFSFAESDVEERSQVPGASDG